MATGGNRYDMQELAGAFGDLGTLIPFLVGYITVCRLDPVGPLVAFGLFKIVAGLYFKTPVPIQPMKAIGTAAITQAGSIGPGAIWASALFTGIFWLSMGLSGAVTWIARITSRPVVQGLVLGLGLGFLLEGVKLMGGDPLLAAAAVALTFLLLRSQRVPAMLVLLALGVAAALLREPDLLAALGGLRPHLRLPDLTWARFSREELLIGIFVLGLPQVALTLGNAILATVEENNSHFPDRPISVRLVAVDHGLMNLASFGLGGIPVCHGAGGMAGHIRFGARTGGALVMHGALVLSLGLLFSDSIATLLRLIPPAFLGVILFFAGLELAAGPKPERYERPERVVLLLTAGVSMWNMGVGYVAGLALWYAVQRGWVRL